MITNLLHTLTWWAPTVWVCFTSRCDGDSTICTNIRTWIGAGWDPLTTLFFALTVTGGFGVLLLMTATCLAVLVFFARQRAARVDVGVWTRIIAPVLALAALSYAVYLTVTQYGVLLGLSDPHAWQRWAFPAAFAVVVALGLAWGAVLKVVRPDVYARIGQGPQASTISPPAAPAPIPTGRV